MSRPRSPFVRCVLLSIVLGIGGLFLVDGEDLPGRWAWADPNEEAEGPAGEPGGPGSEIPTLTDGESLEVKMPSKVARWTGRFEALSDVVALTVVVSADRDVDAFLRYGSPPGEDLVATADAVSISEAPHEILRLDPTTPVRVRSGVWYVTVANPFPKGNGLSFEVAVFVDREGGRRTLLPGSPILATIPRPGRAFMMRTWLPRRTIGAVVDLDPAIPEGLRFRADGPGGFARRETTQQRIVLGTEDAPRGVYTLQLSAPLHFRRALRPQVSLTWRFPGGFVLPRPPSPLVEPGVSVPVLMGGPANGSVQPLRIPVREGTGGFVLGATSTPGVNVDLYVRRGSPPRRKDEDAQWVGLSAGPAEEVVVGGNEPLPAGTYHAEVVLVDEDRPVEVIVRVHALPVGGGPATWGAEEPPALAVDTWVDGTVKVFHAALSWHAVDVPAGTRSLHAQLLDASGPLELVLVSSADGRIVARAFTPLVDELLVHTFRDAAGNTLEQDTRYFLGVLNRATWDKEVTYRIAVGLDAGPELPRDRPWPPGTDMTALSAAERTAAATVEITIGDCSGGSGVCVSPRGLVVSCRHCLKLKEGVGGVQQAGIIVAFPHEVASPPVQAFYAKILDEDPERDLVLLAPLRDVFNRPLPDDLELPWLPIGDSGRLRLGEEVWVGGYPQVGSECTRTAVILSKGIVAGLEHRRDGPAWIKTDAWVAPGHSGGPLVDARGELVGIAAATLGTTESLGLAIPVSRLPERWRERIAEQLEGEPAEEGDFDD